MAPAAAQGERGVIGGTVADAQGGVLPGVTVTARNINTGFTQTAVTEGDGKYRFGALPLGTYEIKAELTGFTTATVTNLVLTVNRELQQNITMGLSTLQESVTVTGQAPVVEVTKSEVSSELNCRPFAPKGGTPFVVSSGSCTQATPAPPRGPVRHMMPWNESDTYNAPPREKVIAFGAGKLLEPKLIVSALPSGLAALRGAGAPIAGNVATSSTGVDASKWAGRRCSLDAPKFNM